MSNNNTTQKTENNETRVQQVINAYHNKDRSTLLHSASVNTVYRESYLKHLSNKKLAQMIIFGERFHQLLKQEQREVRP